MQLAANAGAGEIVIVTVLCSPENRCNREIWFMFKSSYSRVDERLNDVGFIGIRRRRDRQFGVD